MRILILYTVQPRCGVLVYVAQQGPGNVQEAHAVPRSAGYLPSQLISVFFTGDGVEIKP